MSTEMFFRAHGTSHRKEMDLDSDRSQRDVIVRRTLQRNKSTENDSAYQP